MDNDKNIIQLTVNLLGSTLSVKTNLKGTFSWRDISLASSEGKLSEIEKAKLRLAAQPLFFHMPVKDVDVVCSDETFKKLGGVLNELSTILKNTNLIMSQVAHLKNTALGNDKILLINVDNHYTYGQFCKTLQQSDPDKILRKDMASGFNAKLRTWEDTELIFDIPDLISYLIDNKIRKIVSINQYFLGTYLRKTGVYLLSLFRMLGVEYVCIDNDAHDHLPAAYYTKRFFNCDSFQRFSMNASLCKHWDEKFQLRNVFHPAIPQFHSDMDRVFLPLKEDYSVVVLSFSRLPDIAKILSPILFVLDHLDHRNLYQELQLWHYSMRHLILNVFKNNESRSMEENTILITLTQSISNFLKFEIIDGIQTDREIAIYGDVYWKHLFPGYYKKWISKDEITLLLSRNNAIQLLMNWAPNIYSNLHISDSIKRGIPFINYPPVVKSNDFDGFKHLEYNDKDSLSHVIENIGTVIHNPELTKAIKVYKKLMSNSLKFMVNAILDKPYDRYKLESENVFREHDDLMEEKVQAYINKNEMALRGMFQALFVEPVPYDINQSKFHNRTYFKRILKFMQNHIS